MNMNSADIKDSTQSVTSKETVYSAKWLRFCKVSFKDTRTPDKILQWESVERTTRPATSDIDGVDIVSVVQSKLKPGQDMIALVLNYRPPVDQFILEFPAGLVDAAETCEQAALRELKEETGLSGAVEFVSPVTYVDPWKSNEAARTVEVRIDADEPSNMNPQAYLQDNEQIQLLYFPLRGLMKALLDFLSRHQEKVGIEEKLYCFALGLQMAERLSSIQDAD